MIARSIRVEGQVQGVFFRDWTVQAAQALGLSGWVCNRADGCVEVYALGDAGMIDRLAERLHHGPDAARVERVLVEEAPVRMVDGFTRRASA